MRDNSKHFTAAITAFIIWGFFAIPLRGLIEYTSGQILYFRILFALLILIVVMFGFRRKALADNMHKFMALTSLQKRSITVLTLVGGLLLTMNWLIFIYIVNHVNIKTASFSYLICPVLTAVLGYILIKENLTRIQWIAVALCAISCIMIGFHSLLEIGYSLVTALTYALYLISQRKNQGFDRLAVLGVQIMFSFVIFSFAYSTLVPTLPTEGYFYGVIFIIASVFTVVPLFLNLFALNKINSATIGILMYLNPIINFSVAFIVFGEEVTILQLAGYMIILAALVLFNIPTFRRLRKSVAV
ncbi:MAG TPA: EamA family transporter [Chryseosolibacter sp.]|nr:EamA family transporter [Chryseosolibacter sp.]